MAALRPAGSGDPGGQRRVEPPARVPVEARRAGCGQVQPGELRQAGAAVQVRAPASPARWRSSAASDEVGPGLALPRLRAHPAEPRAWSCRAASFQGRSRRPRSATAAARAAATAAGSGLRRSAPPPAPAGRSGGGGGPARRRRGRRRRRLPRGRSGRGSGPPARRGRAARPCGCARRCPAIRGRRRPAAAIWPAGRSRAAARPARGQAEGAGHDAAHGGDAVGEAGGQQGAGDRPPAPGCRAGRGGGGAARRRGGCGGCAAVGPLRVVAAVQQVEAEGDVARRVAAADRVALLQQRGEVGGQRPLALGLGRGQHGAGQPRMGAEPRHAAAGRGDRARSVQRVEVAQQGAGGGHRAGGRRVEEGQRRPAPAPQAARSRARPDSSASRISGRSCGRQAAVQRLRPQPDGDARRGAAGAAGALLGGGPGDADGGEAGQPGRGVEPRGAAEAAIHHDADAGHGQRGLGDGGGQHHLAASPGAERAVLLGGRHLAVQRQHVGVDAGQPLGGAADLAPAGQEGEHVACDARASAARMAPAMASGRSRGSARSRGRCSIATGKARPRLSTTGSRRAGAAKAAPSSVADIASSRSSGRSARLQVEAERQGEVGVEVALMRLVEQHGATPSRPGSDCRRRTSSPSVTTSTRVAAETARSSRVARPMVPPGASFAQQLRHAAGGGAGGDAAGLQHQDAAVGRPRARRAAPAAPAWSCRRRAGRPARRWSRRAGRRQEAGRPRRRAGRGASGRRCLAAAPRIVTGHGSTLVRRRKSRERFANTFTAHFRRAYPALSADPRIREGFMPCQRGADRRGVPAAPADAADPARAAGATDRRRRRWRRWPRSSTRPRSPWCSSFGADRRCCCTWCAADPAMPVLFLDTGKLFRKRSPTAARLTRRLGLRDLRVVRPDAEELAAVDPFGGLWSADPDRCCALRKTAPLCRALAGFDVWISGRKRHQASTRAACRCSRATSDGRLKANPLAAWSAEALEAYRVAHDLPAQPLVDARAIPPSAAALQGRVLPGEDPRAGRWRGSRQDRMRHPCARLTGGGRQGPRLKQARPRRRRLHRPAPRPVLSAAMRLLLFLAAAAVPARPARGAGGGKRGRALARAPPSRWSRTRAAVAPGEPFRARPAAAAGAGLAHLLAQCGRCRRAARGGPAPAGRRRGRADRMAGAGAHPDRPAGQFRL